MAIDVSKLQVRPSTEEEKKRALIGGDPNIAAAVAFIQEARANGKAEHDSRTIGPFDSPEDASNFKMYIVKAVGKLRETDPAWRIDPDSGIKPRNPKTYSYHFEQQGEQWFGIFVRKA